MIVVVGRGGREKFSLRAEAWEVSSTNPINSIAICVYRLNLIVLKVWCDIVH